jgi:hypothetical protein
MKSGFPASQVASLQRHPHAGLVYGTHYIDADGDLLSTRTIEENSTQGTQWPAAVVKLATERKHLTDIIKM